MSAFRKPQKLSDTAKADRLFPRFIFNLGEARIILFLLLYFALLVPEGEAQIVPDATLPINSIVKPQGNINAIEGGTRAGGNLFHSFREFSLPTGTEAFFNNGLDIKNILTRVTGNSISNIDGLIRANGTANLFLINPNGIIFGPNARLNIGGSLFASTANSIKFSSSIEFSATNPQASPLLSVNVPIGLQYGANPGEIRVQGKGQNLGSIGERESFARSLNPLEVLPGNTIALAGGNIIIDGGILQAPDGRIELGGLAGDGTIELNGDGSFNFPDGVPRSNVSILNKGAINVVGSGGGSITINAANIDISGASLLGAGIAKGLGTPDAQEGNISLNTTETIAVASSRIENNINANAIGNSGGINMIAKSIAFTQGAVMDVSTFGQGRAGNVKIVASDTISFDGVDEDGIPTGAGSTVGKNAAGYAGGIDITTKFLTLTNGARLTADNLGQGQGGSVRILASDTVSLDGGAGKSPTAIASSVDENAVGDAGGISITTKFLTLTNGALLDTSTRGQGNAGSVTIVASDTVSFDGGGQDKRATTAGSTVSKNAVGDGGGIDITTKTLTVTNGALLSADTFGQGNAGKVTIAASDRISFDSGETQGTPSGVTSVVREGAVGDAGGIKITTNSLTLTNGAQLTAGTAGKGNAGGISITTKFLSLTNGAALDTSTSGQGNAGSLTIVASDTVSFDGVGQKEQATTAGSTVSKDAVGNGGGIDITTKTLTVTNGALLSADTFGQGNAGKVTIVASDRISFDAGGRTRKAGGVTSAVREDAVGDAGGINIITNSFTLTNGSKLTAGTAGKGNAGSINITTNSLTLTNGAALDTSTSGQGNAGSVTIAASDTISFDGAENTEVPTGASSTVSEDALGDGGDIDITARSLFLTNGAVLTSTSKGTGAAGNIAVEADAIFLGNQAEISTETIKGNNPLTEDQASIRLQTQSLILRQNSTIATNARGSQIVGGNITINTDVLAALENSDISANSLNDRGGTIAINTQGIFGAQSLTREELQTLLNTNDTNLLDPKLLSSSDITATGADSSLSGTVTINTPNVNPSAGLVDLPDNLVDATRLVVSACRPNSKEQNRLAIVGRGGLPPNPLESISGNATWIDLRTSLPSTQRGRRETSLSTQHPALSTEIVEAQGWVINSKGEVKLVASGPIVTPYSSIFPQQQCHTP